MTEKPFSIRSLFGMKKHLSVGFYVTDFIFRKLLRNNRGVKWPMHFTSTVRCPENVTFGKDVYPGNSPGVYINAYNGVHIGDYTNVGPNVGIISTNHDFIKNDTHTLAESISIGNFCWLGMGSVVLPGVKLADFTIVGAGAVVTKSFTEGYCIIAGNPAKIIRYLNKEQCDSFAQSKS